jgi:cytochrome c biogenesis protein
MLPEGDEVLIANVLRSAGTAIPGVPLPDGARSVIELNRFVIDYRSDGSIAQYRSVLTERDLYGNVKRQKEIYVNEPMRFGGVTLYQVRNKLVTLRGGLAVCYAALCT